MSKRDDRTDALVCSFCGKGQEEVKKLIAGPTVYICDECIELCNDIIAEETRLEETEGPDVNRLPKPQEISEVLDDRVHGQTFRGGDAEEQHSSSRSYRLR
jgi:ATP-dependent Clp protease ATP-binding subunit ClpX